MCRYGKKNSYYDFDILMYTACVLEKTTDSKVQLHANAYALAKHDLQSEKFNRLIDSNKFYRNSVHKSPENFYSQLPFYRIKPLYVWLLSAAHQFGYSPFLFSTYINLFSYSFIAFILFAYLAKAIGFYKGFFISFCFILLPAMLDNLKSNTPDLFAALLLLLGILFLISKKQSVRYAAIPMLGLLIYTRSENIIFVVSFCLVCALTRPLYYSRKYLLALILVSVTSYLTLVFRFQQYPWMLLYKHSFLGYIPNLQDASHTLTIADYFKGLKVLPNSVFYSDFFLMILLFALPLFYGKNKTSLPVTLSYSFLLSAAIRVVLFPDLSMRFYIGFFIISLLAFVVFLDKRKSLMNPSEQDQAGEQSKEEPANL